MASSLFKLLGQLGYLSARIAGGYLLYTGKLALQRLAIKRLASSAASTGAATAKIGKANMTVEEACKILDVETTSAPKIILERFKRNFEANDGTSLYIQSKFVRARQRLEAHFGKSLEDLMDKK